MCTCITNINVDNMIQIEPPNIGKSLILRAVLEVYTTDTYPSLIHLLTTASPTLRKESNTSHSCRILAARESNSSSTYLHGYQGQRKCKHKNYNMRLTHVDKDGWLEGWMDGQQACGRRVNAQKNFQRLIWGWDSADTHNLNAPSTHLRQLTRRHDRYQRGSQYIWERGGLL